jgi:hypothetical protein
MMLAMSKSAASRRDIAYRVRLPTVGMLVSRTAVRSQQVFFTAFCSIIRYGTVLLLATSSTTVPQYNDWWAMFTSLTSTVSTL